MSLRLRVLAAFAYVLVLVIVALEVPLALSLSSRVDTEVEAEAAGRAQLLAAAANDSLGDAQVLDRLVTQASRDLGGRVIVVGARGRLLADSAGEGLLREPYGNRPEIRQALTGTIAQGRRRSDTLDQDLLYTAVPIVHNGRTVGAVRVTQSLAAVDARVERNTLALVAVGLVALLLGLALAWLLAGSLARPLHALAGTARRLGRGDLEARAEVAGPSEQRDVARAFNEMAERLERLLEAQREFAANASHQLRTPLTGLRLRLEAASLKADDPELERELAAAEREAERLARLVGSLLALARADRPELHRPTSLPDACTRAAERWGAQAARNGQQLVLATSEALALAADDDVAIVLDNLIENALSYSPPGTTVTLECGRDDSTAWLSVSDEGPGLTEEERERVWERFARGSAGERAPGTGLGLAVVETLVERWGGQARLVSSPSGGTRAEVRFPAAQWVAAPVHGSTEAVRT